MDTISLKDCWRSKIWIENWNYFTHHNNYYRYKVPRVKLKNDITNLCYVNLELGHNCRILMPQIYPIFIYFTCTYFQKLSKLYLLQSLFTLFQSSVSYTVWIHLHNGVSLLFFETLMLTWNWIVFLHFPAQYYLYFLYFFSSAISFPLQGHFLIEERRLDTVWHLN